MAAKQSQFTSQFTAIMTSASTTRWHRTWRSGSSGRSTWKTCNSSPSMTYVSYRSIVWQCTATTVVCALVLSNSCKKWPISSVRKMTWTGNVSTTTNQSCSLTTRSIGRVRNTAATTGTLGRVTRLAYLVIILLSWTIFTTQRVVYNFVDPSPPTPPLPSDLENASLENYTLWSFNLECLGLWGLSLWELSPESFSPSLLYW